VIFIDDYANTMIVGSTMRPVTDRRRISREKLAFLVDATAAPIAGIALISTWVGYEISQLEKAADTLDIAMSGYAMFLDALGFRFYCIVMIAFVLLGAYFGSDFGPMARAERRTRESGKLLDDDARPMSDRSLSSAEAHPGIQVRASVAVIPLVALLVFFLCEMWIFGGGLTRPIWDVLRPSAWRDVFGTADSIPLLARASGFGLAIAIAMVLLVSRVPLGAIARAVGIGIRGAMVPIGILILAWSLQAACNDLQTGTFLANALAEVVSPLVFPALVFVVAGVTAFATGTSFGTMAIVIPTAIPVAFRLDGDIYGPVTVLSVAAVLDGAIFGDHCSPISDTTIMSSAASACDHLAHVRTQMPYSLTVAAMALCLGYLPAAMGATQWVGIVGGAALSGLLFAGLRRWERLDSSLQ
jgi:Na+/H+ antiporter NhaC